jgi:co-chaperonin GroES (HSP10)
MRVLVLLRGRVVVRIDDEPSRLLHVVRGEDREQKIHRGEVLAVGPGAFTKKGVAVPLDVQPGDKVYFHFEGTEKGRRAPWTDGDDALWLMHRELDAVVEAVDGANDVLDVDGEAHLRWLETGEEW